MEYQAILEEVLADVAPHRGEGTVAGYIPALAGVDPGKFAMAVTTVEGERFQVGDGGEPFSLQSISKLFTLAMALQLVGSDLWQRVGREPSGSPFNSLVQLEHERGIPRNPFINAGAIVMIDVLLSHLPPGRGLERMLEFVRAAADDPTIGINGAVAHSERWSGHRNFALAHFIKSFGNLTHPVEEVLDLYFHLCALEMSCQALSRAVLFLANDGVDPLSGRELLSAKRARRINAILLTCGHYDASGDFAFRVGLPGKSGVGGGIVAVVPGRMGVAVWSPGLNQQGNSLVGTMALERFTHRTGLSIF